MTKLKSAISYEDLKRDPGAIFSAPEEIKDDSTLTTSQKIELLRGWAYDASELEVAEEEGMIGGEISLLDRILAVLDEVSNGFDVSHTPPTKQEGV